MEEFVEKFQEFRDWLYAERKNVIGERTDELETIINKFEELKLDNVF